MRFRPDQESHTYEILGNGTDHALWSVMQAIRHLDVTMMLKIFVVYALGMISSL